MVLKALPLIYLLLCAPLGWTADLTAYNQAVVLHSKHKDTQALQKLESHYNFGKKDTPLKVATLAASLADGLKNWRKVDEITEAALHANDSDWPPTGKDGGELAKRLKGRPKPFLLLVSLAARAKSQMFVTHGTEMDDDMRAKVKGQIKTYTDALIEAGYEADNAQATFAQVQAQEDLAQLEEYKFSLAASLSYQTWEDRPVFDYAVTGHAVLFSPCLGVALNYANAFYHWTGGACVGVGTGDIQFNDGHFDNHASVVLVSGFGSLLLPLTGTSAEFGIEGDVMSVAVAGTNAQGTRTTANGQDFSILAVGQFHLSSLDVKFKGGTIIGNPCAIWAIELAYPFYRF